MIQRSHKEKIELLKEKEEKIFARYIKSLEKSLQQITYENVQKDYVITYFFRKTMPENTALYKDSTELYNRSPYEFETGALEGDENIIYSKQEQINGKYLLVLHEKIRVGKQPYTLCYIVDDTFIYKSSINFLD